MNILCTWIRAGFAVILGSAVACAARADAVSDFYAGKTVTLVVPVAPGGSYSLFAQFLQQHLGRHIPGNPNVVVQHMTGAGGLTATAWLYSVAPKDGTVIATLNTTPTTWALLNQHKINFDPLKFTWLGAWNETVTVLFVLDTAPAQTIEAAKNTELVMGSIGSGSLTYMLPALLNTYVGTKFKIVTGYPGANNVYMAMDQGELHGSTALAESLNASRQEWVERDRMRILLQIARKPYSQKWTKVPLLTQLAVDEESRQAFEFLTAGGMTARALQLPPGVPRERVEALRKAVAATFADPAFLDGAKRLKFEVDPVSSEEVFRAVGRMAALPQPLKEKLRVLLGD